MRLFPILFAFDALGLLALVYFFLDGLRYPSSGGDYLGTWLPLLLVPAAMLAGALALRRAGPSRRFAPQSERAANALLGVLAVPFALYGLFVLAMVVVQPSFH
jgi:hypothetical protein